MSLTEPNLAWLERLMRGENRLPQVFAESVGAGAGEPLNSSRLAAFETELQKRLGQVVFSMMCEEFGSSTSIPVHAEITTNSLSADHLRAARALLNWSMSDLAVECGLSISTIKRAELNPKDVTWRTYKRVVETLWMGGIRFLTLDDGTIAIGKASRAKSSPAASRAGVEHHKASEHIMG